MSKKHEGSAKEHQEEHATKIKRRIVDMYRKELNAICIFPYRNFILSAAVESLVVVYRIDPERSLKYMCEVDTIEEAIDFIHKQP